MSVLPTRDLALVGINVPTQQDPTDAPAHLVTFWLVTDMAAFQNVHLDTGNLQLHPLKTQLYHHWKGSVQVRGNAVTNVHE